MSEDEADWRWNALNEVGTVKESIEILSFRIVALADRVTVLEAAFAEQHAINESVANTLETILEGLK